MQSTRQIIARQCNCDNIRLRVLTDFPGVAPFEAFPGRINQVAFSVDAPWRLGGSRKLRNFLRDESSPDIYHLHGVWHRAMAYGANEAVKRSRPYIVELFGSYDPALLAWKPFRKKLIRFLYQDAVLKNASCLHVNSMTEGENLRKLGFRNPIAVIPGPVNLQTYGGSSSQKPILMNGVGRYFLYLARIDRKKGIECLLDAWEIIDNMRGDFKVVIAGVGEDGDISRYRNLVESKKMSSSVVWLGRVHEKEKCWLYENCHVYVLPTSHENFGNTIAEAMAFRRPVITTVHTPWDEIVSNNCGWIIQRDSTILAFTMKQAMSMKKNDLDEMGWRGRCLIEEKFSLDIITNETRMLYKWLLGGDKPMSVQM